MWVAAIKKACPAEFQALLPSNSSPKAQTAHAHILEFSFPLCSVATHYREHQLAHVQISL